MINTDIKELINLYNSGQLDDVIEKTNILITKNPDNYFLYNILGTVFSKQNKLDKATENYKKSLKFNPNFFEGFYNLGVVLKRVGKINESIESYIKAIKLKPNYSKAYNNLGNIYNEIGKNEEAINNYQAAVKSEPNFADAYYNLANIFMKIGKFDEAKDHYVKTIDINPNHAPAYDNLGNWFLCISRAEEANKYFKKASDLKPNNIAYALDRELVIAPIVQSKKEIDFYRNSYKKGLSSLKSNKYIIDKSEESSKQVTFNIAYHNEDNFEMMKRTSDLFKKITPNINYISKNIDMKKKQIKKLNMNANRIRIGFISDFFYNHTIAKLFGGLIKNINKKKFEVLVFHTSKTVDDFVKKDIDRNVDKVINLSSKIQEQQKQVEDENLDIFFYTDIGMSSVTYFLAFSRLAPVQIVCWGHPETTGIETIDYFLSSSLFETKNSKSNYTERLICLSQFPIYYEPPESIEIGELKKRSNLGLPEKVRIYGCPQSLFKLHPDFDSILANIINQDKEGYVALIGGDGKEKYWTELLKKRWSKNFPILNKKVLFTKKLSLLEFVSFCDCVDVLLDPLHFGGGNTFLESMIPGTPNITMPGDYLKKNIASGAYKQMKISNPPIVKNTKDYVKLAIKLAKNKDENLSLRKKSRIAAKKFLFNNKKALEEFENFLVEVFNAEKKGKKLKSGSIFKS